MYTALVLTTSAMRASPKSCLIALLLVVKPALAFFSIVVQSASNFLYGQAFVFA
jgi:hypothetical protein